jgi:hypothetical protein
VSISKQRTLPAGTALSLRVEVLNLFNIVQWSAPATSAFAFGNANFGQITNQANNMRMVQFTRPVPVLAPSLARQQSTADC